MLNSLNRHDVSKQKQQQTNKQQVTARTDIVP